MTAFKASICPLCGLAVERSHGRINVNGARHHWGCAARAGLIRSRGRPASPRGRDSPLVGVRLSSQENARLEAAAASAGITVAELLRQRTLSTIP